MAVSANTLETFDVTTIKEDLQDALINISPTDTPFMSSISTKNVNNTYFEWATVDLASADGSNRKIEGDSATNSAPTNAVRRGNYTQISDKVVEVSSTAEAVQGAGNNQTLAKQIALKLKELKRDMETMLTSNTPASAGASGTARQTAGLASWLISNVDRGATGANPTTSGSGDSGYPDAGATDGTQRDITEALFKNVIKSCWDNGAEPSVVLCGSHVKQEISTFSGNSTKYKDISDKKLSTAIDIYESDFGQLQIVPSRFSRARDVFVLDPSYARVAYLSNVKQTPLAKTGHSDRRLISVEYGLQVDSEKAHGIFADANTA